MSCTTHHPACDCREAAAAAELLQMERELTKARELAEDRGLMRVRTMS